MIKKHTTVINFYCRLFPIKSCISICRIITKKERDERTTDTEKIPMAKVVREINNPKVHPKQWICYCVPKEISYDSPKTRNAKINI